MTLTLTHFNEYRPTAPFSGSQEPGTVTRGNNLYKLLHPFSYLHACIHFPTEYVVHSV